MRKTGGGMSHTICSFRIPLCFEARFTNSVDGKEKKNTGLL